MKKIPSWGIGIPLKKLRRISRQIIIFLIIIFLEITAYNAEIKRLAFLIVGNNFRNTFDHSMVNTHMPVTVI